MKKKSDKQIVILCMSVVFILLAILAWVAIGVIKEFNVKATSATISELSEEVINKSENITLVENEATETNNEIKENKSKENKKTTDKNSSVKKKTTNNENPYYIKVNYKANTITVYGKDENNEYTVPVKAMICSTGSATPRSGTYSIRGKWRWLRLMGGVYGQYSSQIVGNILFHSVPCSRKSNDSLKYALYDKLGTACSAGCVRLTVIDAKWIYENAVSGTKVEFYASSDPGPLGKPVAQKISGNEECRNWDPTDPDPNNPWHKTEKEVIQESEDNIIDTSNNETVEENNVIDSGNNETVEENNVIDSGNNETVEENNVIDSGNNEVGEENNTVNEIENHTSD